MVLWHDAHCVTVHQFFALFAMSIADPLELVCRTWPSGRSKVLCTRCGHSSLPCSGMQQWMFAGSSWRTWLSLVQFMRFLSLLVLVLFPEASLASIFVF